MTISLLAVCSTADHTERCLFTGLAQKCGFKVDMVIDPKESHQEELRAAGINLHILHIRNRFDFKSAWQIRKIIKAGHYDVVFATSNRGLSTALFATIGMKSIQVAAYRGTMGNISRWDPSCWIAHLHPRLRMIVCNCHAVKNFLSDFGLPEKKLTTIYKGHRLAWYQNEISDAKTFKDLGLDIPEGNFIVGCVANVRELKGIDYVIRAIAELKDLPIQFIVVGKNDDPQYDKLAEELGIKEKVHLLGFRSDAVVITRMFNISVMASTRREGVPRSIVESMSQGIPAVVTNVGGLPELVRDGENGIVVPAKDSHALAQAINTLYQDKELLARYSKAAKEWINECFNADKALTAYKELFIKLAEEKR